MEVILLQDIDKVGSKYDVVSVRPGFGRNYLIPQGLAKIANESNKKHLSEIAKQRSAKIAKLAEEMSQLAEKLKNTKVVVGAKAGTSGKLFGSVTNIQLSDAIKKQLNVEIDRKKIHLQGEVKETGAHKATINLFKDVTAEIEFEVVAE
jgi:large subunit ribosomal protein L9